MILALKRQIFTDKFTVGKLYYNNGKGEIYICDTLEDKYRGQDMKACKIYGQTCIPYGNYKAVNSFSPKFNRILPLIMNVPEFTGIRIHSGNIPEDSLGCILVGKFNGKRLVDSTINFAKLWETLKFFKQGYELHITHENI